MAAKPKCSHCHGTRHAWKPCHDCGGEGALEDCHTCGQTRTCKTCRGTGLLTDRENPCLHCSPQTPEP